MIYNKQIRQTRNITQTELGSILNISHQAISKWETGKSLPDIETVFKLAKILNCTIEDLFTEVA